MKIDVNQEVAYYQEKIVKATNETFAYYEEEAPSEEAIVEAAIDLFHRKIIQMIDEFDENQKLQDELRLHIKAIQTKKAKIIYR